mmetsp:Transcript_68589/g.146802  ORF Transcript_68589/g.146802 Transcript_68589/m.146802 type:complete len:240 (-) Transcript_68589:776-1495(-)
MLEIICRVPCHGCSKGSERGASKAVRFDRRYLAQAETAKVRLWKEAMVIQSMVDAVNVKIAIETKHLDDVVKIFDDPARIQDCCPWFESLYCSLNNFGPIIIQSTEGSVADAPPSGLLDCRNSAVVICSNTRKLPRVPTNEAVHGQEGIKDGGRGRRHASLIDIPADAPWQEEVEVACDDVNLGSPKLHDRAAVFSSESTKADHDAVLVTDPPVVELVTEPVRNLPTKDILSRPSLAAR